MTQRKEELDAIETTDMSAMLQTQISEDISEEMRERRVGRDLLVDDATLQNSEGKSIKFLRRGTLNAHPVSESEEAQFDKVNGDGTYTEELSRTVRKFSAASQISREAITDGMEDIVSATEEEIADALSDTEDIVALGSLAGGKLRYQEEPSSIDTTGDTLTVTNTPVFEVIDARDTTTSPPSSISDAYVSDYDNGTISTSAGDITGATTDYDVTYVGLANADLVDSDTSGDVSPKLDILSTLRKNIAANKYDPDTVVMNETNLTDIMSSSNFIDASKYGTNEILYNGELGKLFGMRIVISSQMPDNYVIAGDVGADPAKFIVKEDVRTNQKEKLTSDDVKIVSYQRYNACLRKSNAVQVLKVIHS